MSNKLNQLIFNGVFNPTYVSKLDKNSYANIFDVIIKGEQSYFNLCKGIRFNNNDHLDIDKYQDYVIVENDAWTIISYKYYGTIDLWWLICKFNGIKNPFKELIPGTVIKIPSTELKDVILNVLNSY